MVLRLLLLFTLLPLIELFLLIWLTRATNLWVTLGIMLGTALLGVILARRQGWGAWSRVRGEMSRGSAPAANMLDGMMILIAAILLIVPGPITDVCGLVLMVPVIRRRLQQFLLARLMHRATARFQAFTAAAAAQRAAHGGGPQPRSQNPNIIDAEFTREPPPQNRLPDSGAK